MGNKNNRDHVTQTQAGFYKNKVVKIELPENDEIYEGHINANINKIHKNQNPANMSQYNSKGKAYGSEQHNYPPL